MPHIHSVALCSLLFCWLPSVVAVQPADEASIPKDVRDLEASVLEARSALKSGRFMLIVNAYEKPVNGEVSSEPIQTFQEAVIFRGESVRIERPQRNGVREIHILHNGAWSHRTLSPDPAEQSAPQVHYGARTQDRRIYDPRLLGMYGSFFHAIYGLKLSDGIGVHKRTAATLTEETVDGRVLKHIRSIRPPADGVERGVSKWIDPSQGLSLVRVKFDDTHQQKEFVDETSFQLQQFGDVWFPVRIESSRTIEGMGSIIEIVELSDVELNIDISDDEFSFARLEPEIGESFHEEPPYHPKLSRQWDGEQLVLMGNISAATPPPLPAEYNWRPWIIGGGSLAGCLFCGLFIAFRRKAAA